MAVDYQERQIIQDLTPKIRIIEFGVLPNGINSEAKFSAAVRELTENETLPSFFPNVPDYKRAKDIGLSANPEYIDSKLTLPIQLLDSSTYSKRPDLRGPLEEIIIAYDQQRELWKLPQLIVAGEDWSKDFYKRLEEIRRNKTQAKGTVFTEPQAPHEKEVDTNWKSPNFDSNDPRIPHVYRERRINSQGLIVSRVSGKVFPKKRSE